MTNSQTFDESYDVVVAGFGLGGGVSALTAAQAGAKTLLIEKSPVPGGLSICSYGAVRSARDPELAFTYLKATNDGRTPDDVLRVLDELSKMVPNSAHLSNLRYRPGVLELQGNAENASALSASR